MLKHWLFRLHSLTAAAAVAIAAISLISFLLPEEELFSISFFVVLPDVCTEPSDVCKKRLQYVQFDCYLCAMRSIYVIAPSKSTNWTDIIFFSLSLSPNYHFQVYKKKTEAAKKEYLKALAAYRASLVSKVST